MNTVRRIQEVIARSLGIPLDRIQPDTKAADIAEWDSLHHFVIAMEVEEEFGFKLSLEELAELDSVQKILDSIAHRVAA